MISTRTAPIRPLTALLAATILGASMTVPAVAGDQGAQVVCQGKANAENDFEAYYNGGAFTRVVFVDRNSGATTEVPLRTAGRNENGRQIYKGDHPWKKVAVRIVAPQAMSPGTRIFLRWDDYEQKGFCRAI